MSYAFGIPAESIKPESMSTGTLGQIINGLHSRYAEPWRHYHTATHIEAMARFLVENVAELEDPLAVLWATLYHDSIYDVIAPRGHNEEQSARIARSELEDFIDDPRIRKIGQYITDTATHTPSNDDADLDLFLDADLGILGSSPETYDLYADQIRKEYASLTGNFNAGRVDVLRSLLSSERLFITDVAHDKFEYAARQNMGREIDQLRIAS